MRQLSLSLRATLVACALGATAVAAVAQTAHDDSAVSKAVAKKQQSEIAKGDPARWHRAENSAQARLGIQKKEIAAAYSEARNACRKGASSERGKCMKDAQLAYQHDMSKAPLLVAKGPTAEVLEQVSPLADGQTAVGGSGGTSATAAGGGVPDIGQNVPREYRPLGKDNGQAGSSESGSTQSGVSGKDTGQPDNGASGSSQSGTTGVGAPPTESNGSDATRPGAPPPDMPPAGKPVEQH
jgi:hypothetical protein